MDFHQESQTPLLTVSKLQAKSSYVAFPERVPHREPNYLWKSAKQARVKPTLLPSLVGRRLLADERKEEQGYNFDTRHHHSPPSFGLRTSPPSFKALPVSVLSAIDQHPSTFGWTHRLAPALQTVSPFLPKNVSETNNDRSSKETSQIYKSIFHEEVNRAIGAQSFFTEMPSHDVKGGDAGKGEAHLSPPLPPIHVGPLLSPAGSNATFRAFIARVNSWEQAQAVFESIRAKSSARLEAPRFVYACKLADSFPEASKFQSSSTARHRVFSDDAAEPGGASRLLNLLERLSPSLINTLVVVAASVLPLALPKVDRIRALVKAARPLISEFHAVIKDLDGQNKAPPSNDNTRAESLKGFAVLEEMAFPPLSAEPSSGPLMSYPRALEVKSRPKNSDMRRGMPEVVSKILRVMHRPAQKSKNTAQPSQPARQILTLHQAPTRRTVNVASLSNPTRLIRKLSSSVKRAWISNSPLSDGLVDSQLKQIYMELKKSLRGNSRMILNALVPISSQLLHLGFQEAPNLPVQVVLVAVGIILNWKDLSWSAIRGHLTERAPALLKHTSKRDAIIDFGLGIQLVNCDLSALPNEAFDEVRLLVNEDGLTPNKLNEISPPCALLLQWVELCLAVHSLWVESSNLAGQIQTIRERDYFSSRVNSTEGGMSSNRNSGDVVSNRNRMWQPAPWTSANDSVGYQNSSRIASPMPFAPASGLSPFPRGS